MHPNLKSLFASAKSWLRRVNARPFASPRALHLEQLETRDVPSAATLLNWALPAGGGEFTLTLQDQVLRLDQVGGGTLFQANANLTTVQIDGTTSAETIHIDFSRVDPSKGLQVVLQTHGGGDQVDIQLSPNAETVALAPKSALITTLSYQVQVNDAESITVGGGGGKDLLQMTDGPGDDSVNAAPGLVLMSQTGVYENRAEGFPNVRIDVNAAEDNHAALKGSAVNDLVDLAGKKVTLTAADKNWNVVLNGFTHVAVDGNSGNDDDKVIVRDSVLSDELIFRPNLGLLKRGDGIEHEFQGFERILFYANSGGKKDVDIVRLFDSSAAETFRAVNNIGMYLADNLSFDFRFYNVNAVYLDGSAGGLNLLSMSRNKFPVYATGFMAASQFAFKYRLTRATALYWIKKVALSMRPDLAAVTDKMELAVKLRDWVHQRTLFGPNTQTWADSDPYARFYATMVSRHEAVLCQGRAWVYRDLLIAFGIPAREVSLFSPTVKPNHASTEVFIDKHWFVMDSTFNVSFTNDAGKYLSYAEMKKLGHWNVERQGTINHPIYTLDLFYPYRLYLYRIQYPAIH